MKDPCPLRLVCSVSSQLAAFCRQRLRTASELSPSIPTPARSHGRSAATAIMSPALSMCRAASIDFDRTAHTISGSVVVAAGSGNSGEASRDKKMNKDVLDVEHYSEITFVPQKYDGTIAPTGDSTIQVSGTFTLHGTPHDLSVPMQIRIDGGALTCQDALRRALCAMGIERPSIFMLKVAKEVDIDLTLIGKVAKQES